MFSRLFDQFAGGRQRQRQQAPQTHTRTQAQSDPPVVTQPPPASEWYRANLPLVHVTADDLLVDNNAECVVCFEDHVVGHTACKLPCGHIFHPECVSEWLCKQASCPICRYEVETDDASYEVNRKKRMRERKVRYRKDELMAKSVKELKSLLGMYSLTTHGCVDKRDMVERLIESGRVDVIQGVPTMDMTREQLDAMSVSEIKQLLLDFDLTGSSQYRNALEKHELVQCLLDSSRVNLIVSSSTIESEHDITT